MSTRVNNLAITRLFSTGRFEHTKLSVSVEPGSRPPGQLMREIEGIIEALNPACPVDSHDLECAIDVSKAEDDPPAGSFRDKEWAADVIRRHKEWSARREAAYARLDALGGSIAEESSES